MEMAFFRPEGVQRREMEVISTGVVYEFKDKMLWIDQGKSRPG
jgi:hypothetical protein